MTPERPKERSAGRQRQGEAVTGGVGAVPASRAATGAQVSAAKAVCESTTASGPRVALGCAC